MPEYRVESGELDQEIEAADVEEAARMALGMAFQEGLTLAPLVSITPLDDVLIMSTSDVLRELGLVDDDLSAPQSRPPL